jgi:hypothetical protein
MSSTIAPHPACAMNSRKPAKTMPELTQIAPPDLTIPHKTLRFRVIRPPGEFFLRVAIHSQPHRNILALEPGPASLSKYSDVACRWAFNRTKQN